MEFEADERFEWNADKAASNFANHGVTFGEAATVFDNRLAVTFPDLDHSDHEDRWITIGDSATRRSGGPYSPPTPTGTDGFGSSAPVKRRPRSVINTKMSSSRPADPDDLRPEYDLGRLGAGVRGKYLRRNATKPEIEAYAEELTSAFPPPGGVPAGGRLAPEETRVVIKKMDD